MGRDPEDAAAFGDTNGPVCENVDDPHHQPVQVVPGVPAVVVVDALVDPDPVALGAFVLGGDRYRNLVPARRQVHLVADGHQVGVGAAVVNTGLGVAEGRRDGGLANGACHAHLVGSPFRVKPDDVLRADREVRQGGVAVALVLQVVGIDPVVVLVGHPDGVSLSPETPGVLVARSAGVYVL